MRARVRGALFAAIALALAACAKDAPPLPALGQLVVYFDTDAIVPHDGAIAYAPLEPYPLFDRVRFDVIADAPCDCTRELALDRETIAAGRASFGIVGQNPGARLRVRMFRHADTEAGEPRDETTVDATYAIDAPPAEGIVARTVFLRTEDVGRGVGADAPLAMIAGRPDAFHAGTWPLGERVDCPAPPRAGEVCVPGGAFWMGSPLEAQRDARSGSQRLVTLAPYYVGATEVTVAAFRKSGLAATPWSGGRFGQHETDFCTFTPAPGSFEDHPINCVTADVARAYCASIGADLPTEAQYEYVAGGLVSAPFVWGTDPPSCDGVVMSRRGIDTAVEGDITCHPIGTIGGTAAVGSGTLDRLTLPSGVIVDLIGNVGEYVRDAWERLVEPCWARSGLYRDPLCRTPSTLDPPPTFTMRGGEWNGTPNRASGRYYANGASPLHGFRCARSIPE